MINVVKIHDIEIANNLPFILIAGPCQIENLDHSLFMAEAILKICHKHNIKLIYKSSYDKANRTSITAQRGAGIDLGLKILSEVKKQFHCPIITDVHEAPQCPIVAEVADIIQIPAFLCRQTDLLKAASDTGRIVNVKKGQFLAPWDMKNVYDKLIAFKTRGVLLTERGASFGYNTLVSDMRSLTIMAETGAPIIFDATHSVQQPGGQGNNSGGERKYVEILARAAVSVGIAGLFMEVHQDPDNAPSDGPCMIKLQNLEQMLVTLKRYDQITKSIINTSLSPAYL